MKRTGEKTRPGTRLLRAAVVLALLAAWNVSVVPAEAADACYPKCSASYESLVDALKSVGADASFSSRQTIAVRNGIGNYTGTAAQNIRLLNLLKSGSLLCPDGGDTESAAPLDTNPAKVRYIAQDAKTCKATAVAMAVNLLRGTDSCTTAGMGGTYCRSIDGLTYTGSDGRTYTGIYKTDSYVGSSDELSHTISAALSAGVPIVAAVHSTGSGTQHHWVVVVGKSGDDYRIADPAFGASGAISDNLWTLSERGYAFGLADSAAPHYGYVTFAEGRA